MAIDQTTVAELFEYKDGALYRKKNGQKAGTRHHTGYTQLHVKGSLFNAHRIIFLLHHGWLPDVIDHIDGNRANDSIENLRAATYQQNLYNMRLKLNNTSGVKGVVWEKQRKKWRVQMSIYGKNTNLGRFNDLELAELVAMEARDKYHGAFAKHF